MGSACGPRTPAPSPYVPPRQPPHSPASLGPASRWVRRGLRNRANLSGCGTQRRSACTCTGACGVVMALVFGPGRNAVRMGSQRYKMIQTMCWSRGSHTLCVRSPCRKAGQSERSLSQPLTTPSPSQTQFYQKGLNSGKGCAESKPRKAQRPFDVDPTNPSVPWDKFERCSLHSNKICTSNAAQVRERTGTQINVRFFAAYFPALESPGLLYCTRREDFTLHLSVKLRD